MSLNWRDIRIILLLTLLVIGLAVYMFTRPPVFVGTVIEPPKAMPNFVLQSARGPVAVNDFRGKLVVLYFGYTNCPDICPLTMANLRQALDRLGDKASQVQVLFISVDWKRDTPEKLAGYASAFRPDFIGVTGSQAQIDAVTKDYGIYYLLNVPDSSGYYSVDHTASLLVLNRQGELTLTWPNGIQPDEIASDLSALLR